MSNSTILGDSRSILTLGLPVVFTMVGNMTLGLVDTFIIGQVSSLELAGVAAGQVIFMAFIMVGQGFISGIEPLLSSAFGAGDHKRLHEVFVQGFWLSLLLSGIVTPCLLLGSPYYGLLGATDEVVEYAIPYLSVVSLGFGPVIVFSYLQRCLQAQNSSMSIAVVMLLTNILNFAADYILVHGLFGFSKMGATGVAWSSVLCRSFAMLALSFVFLKMLKKNGSLSLQKWLVIDWPLLKKAIVIGIPAAAQMTLEVSAFAFATTLAAGISALSLAAHHIVLSVSTFTFMFPLGISMASSVKVSHFIGSGEVKRAYSNGWITLFMGALVMGVFALIFLLFPESLVRIFSSDLEVVGLATGLFAICAFFQIFDGIQVIGAGILRGAGNTSVTLISNLVGHWVVGIPLGVYLCYEEALGIRGLWIGLATGLMITALIAIIAWKKWGEHFCMRGSQQLLY